MSGSSKHLTLFDCTHLKSAAKQAKPLIGYIRTIDGSTTIVIGEIRSCELVRCVILLKTFKFLICQKIEVSPMLGFMHRTSTIV